MKRLIFLILIIATSLFGGCASKSVKPSKPDAIKPVVVQAALPISNKPKEAKPEVVKTNINVVASDGTIVKIPLVSTNIPEHTVVKQTKGKVETVLVPEQSGPLYLVLPKEEVKQAPQKKSYKNLIAYYLGVATVGGFVWFIYCSLFNKKNKTIPSRFLQGGDFPQSPTGGAGPKPPTQV